jgi:hypothetical protein
MILPMTDQLTQTSFLSELLKELRDVWRSFTVAISNSGVSLRNQLRMVQKAELDYIVMPIGGPLPERDAPPRSFIQRQLPLPPDPLSLETLDRRLQAVADAGNVRGVVFVFRGFSAGLATIQNFRSAVLRLRDAGKEVIVYTPYLDLTTTLPPLPPTRSSSRPAPNSMSLGCRLKQSF